MATTSRVTLARDILRLVGSYEEGTLTARASDGTTVTIATWPYKTNRTSESAQKHLGKELYVYSGTAPVPNPNGITTWAPTTGVFTLGMAYTTNPDATASVFLIGNGIQYGDATAALDRALGDLTYRTTVPLTLVPDGDMDSSGTSDWTAVGAGTPTKVTSTGNLLRGSQALRVTGTAADDGVRTASINVNPTQGSTTYYLEAKVRAATGTASLVPYDATNSAAITSTGASTTHDAQGWAKVSTSFTLPSTCEALQVRLLNTATSGDTYWDDVILLHMGATEMDLPSWVTDAYQIKRVLTASGNILQHDRDNYAEYGWWKLRPDASNPLSQFKLWLDPSISAPIWIEALRPYGALATDATTTFANRRLTALNGAIELLDELVSRPGQDVNRWRERLKALLARRNQWNRVLLGGPTIRRAWGEPPAVPAPLVY